MTHGLIQTEILNANRVRAFTPNVRDTWHEEERERDFIAWCNRPESYEIIPPLPDTVNPFRLGQFVKGVLP